MKKALVGLTLVCSLLLGAAYAAPLSAVAVRVVYSGGTVGQGSWTTLYSPLAKSVKGVVIAHSGQQPLGVAVGAVGSEVQQLIIPAGQSAAVFYPFVVSQAQRISIKDLGSTGVSGSAIGSGTFNFLFN